MQHSRDDATSARPAGTSLEALEIELSMFVRRTAAHYLTGSVGQAAEGPLDGWRYPLLVRLAENGPQRSAELARAFGLNRSTLGRHLARLEEAGLVCHADDRHSDGRGHAPSSQFVVTAAGQAALETARRARMGPLSELLGTWPEAQRCELARLLARLNHDLDARDTGVRPRQPRSDNA
ncbi:MAG: MarR family transcriptional regulator [Actinomycetota bacterium]|nr:MarR family transcriptional regulator [Actinomycetota bacterium]